MIMLRIKQLRLMNNPTLRQRLTSYRKNDGDENTRVTVKGSEHCHYRLPFPSKSGSVLLKS